MLAIFCVPFVAGSYGRFVVLLVLINVVAVTGVNLSMGLCGLVSVGHAGFMAIGAYVAAGLMNGPGWGLAPALASGAIAAGAAGIVVGLPGAAVELALYRHGHVRLRSGGQSHAH